MQHHATVVRTSHSNDYLQTIKSDFVLFTYDKVGIEQARELTDQAQLRPTQGETQHFVVQTNFITHEAQNALLKLFEEPPLGTLFTLVVPPAFGLLPTLQSRIGNDLVWQTNDHTNTAWELFTLASYVDRLAQIDSWQKSKEKDPAWLQAMVSGVQSVSLNALKPSDGAALQLVGAKLATRGASNKMLLEHLALLLPLQK